MWIVSIAVEATPSIAGKTEGIIEGGIWYTDHMRLGKWILIGVLLLATFVAGAIGFFYYKFGAVNIPSRVSIDLAEKLPFTLPDMFTMAVFADGVRGARDGGYTPRVGTNAIYKWLYSEDGKPYCRYLCTERTKKKKQSRLKKKTFIPDRISIKQRPDTPGLLHAEGDLFVSPTSSGSTACGLLVVAKEAKLLIGSILPSKKHIVIIPAMRRATRILRPDTYTFDNGVENSPHRQFGVQAYFCDKGAPWQKPQVEGSIGLIRRWFIPKGTNLSGISDETFQSLLHLLNHKYRKSLGYRSAYEVAVERGIMKLIPKKSLSEVIAFR